MPLEDLLVAMRTCKSFCVVVKTSKAVMRNKHWLSLDLAGDECDENKVGIGGNEGVSGADDIAGKEAGDGPEDGGEDEYDKDDDDHEEVFPEAIIAPSFKTRLSFIVPKTTEKDEFTIEMSNHEDAGLKDGAHPVHDQIFLVYRASMYPNRQDTNIRINANDISELWRRVPLSDERVGVVVLLHGQSGNQLGCKHFAPRSTLGDLYVWLGEEAAASGELPYDQPGDHYLNTRLAHATGRRIAEQAQAFRL